MTLKRTLIAAGAAVVLLAAATPAAHASQLIDRNATGVKLQVNARQALLTYRAAGVAKHVVASGAVNALPPSHGRPQVKFTLDYSGRGFSGGGCRPYTGPSLPWVVAACDAPDGSHWAAQAFAYPLPDLGFAPWLPAQRAVWLDLSHWTGDPPLLEVGQDWVYDGRFRQLYGRLTYQGKPVYGFKTTRYGVPVGGYGTLVYLDTHNAAAYGGGGWVRENSFVTHGPSGVFCYGFYPHDPTKGGYSHPPGQAAVRAPGVGDEYRLTAHGPGVAPDVGWTGAALPAYDAGNPQDKLTEQNAVAQIRAWGAPECAAHSG